MALEAAVAPKDHSKAAEQVVAFKIGLRELSHVSVICTWAVIAFCVPVTFFFSDFEKDKDLIYKTFDTFTPCVFFDYFPANLFALLGFSVRGLANVIIMLTVQLMVMQSNHVELNLQGIFGFVVAAIGIVGELQLINIFAGNMYD